MSRPVERAPCLADLVEDLGQLMSVLHAHEDLRSPVRDVVLHDPVHPTVRHPGDLVLGIGLRNADEFERLAADLAAANAAGVVVKGDPGATVSGVTALSVPADVEWGHVHALLRTALAAGTGLGGTEGHDADNLFTLANVVAAVCGGPVVLHDPQWRLLAYSREEDELDEARTETILGRRAPQHWLERFHDDGTVARLVAGDVVHMGAIGTDLAPRSAVAVRAGSELLGSIWLLRTSHVEGPDVEGALREAAGIAALELVRHRVASGAAERTQAEALAQLLSGTASTPVLADRLRVSVDASFVLAGFRPGMTSRLEEVLGLERLNGLVRTFCDAYRLRSRQTVLLDTAWVLIELPTPSARSAAISRLRDAHRQITRGGTRLSAAASRTVPFDALTRARSDVEHLIDSAGDELADAEADISRLQLAQLRSLLSRDPGLVPPKLQALLEQDAQTGGNAVETLRAWLAANGDVQGAAKKLHLHHNTVRYRLHRIAEIYDIDLDDPDQRFLIELHLRLFT